MKIVDSTGTSIGAKVNAYHQLEVIAGTEDLLKQVSDREGNAYYLANQGFISLTTTGTEIGIFYFTNTADEHLHIKEIRTCGDVVQKWRMYKFPTALTNSTEVTPANLNTSSSKTYSGVTSYGSNTSSLTGGTIVSQWINHAGHSSIDTTGALILGPDHSMGLTVEVASAGVVCTNLLVYFEELHT